LLPGIVVSQITGTPPAWETGEITEDGTCGPNTPANWVCTPTWGACCSADGLCGRKDLFCGDGCQQGYGNCNAPPWTGTPSPDGSCGYPALFNCTGSAFGACCSADAQCGDTPTHCVTGCQSLFGTCTDSNITIDGSCGPVNDNKTCAGASFGDCCSSGGYCGNTTAHCSAGCQSAFGNCDGNSGTISTDGRCGANGKTCTGSAFGECCSSGGYCGDTTDHCGAGCQSSSGTCTPGSGNISTDGKCSSNGKTCTGSTFGTCCSPAGSCGGTSAHCGAGCQGIFGTCNPGSENISTDGRCGTANGKTCIGSGLGGCCSATGYCGNDPVHCGQGCQTNYASQCRTNNISTDSKCGTANGKTCVGSGLGGCCSAAGSCGNDPVHCGQGCQKNYASQCRTNNISTDGKCGTANGKTCVSSGFGGCCSAAGSCGNNPSHCDEGCQKGYASQCKTDSISTDGQCGTASGKTCIGSGLGGCCSATGYCGNTPNHCSQGCQKDYASQCKTTNIPSVDGSCGASKGAVTCNGGDFNNQCCSAGGFCGTTSAHCGT
ncbi:carbohydrate-binding module family 18 protein, partial [Trichocladium antarcticum]